MNAATPGPDCAGHRSPLRAALPEDVATIVLLTTAVAALLKATLIEVALSHRPTARWRQLYENGALYEVAGASK